MAEKKWIRGGTKTTGAKTGMALKTKIILCIAVVAVGVLAIGGVSWWKEQQIEEFINELASDEAEIENYDDVTVIYEPVMEIGEIEVKTPEEVLYVQDEDEYYSAVADYARQGITEFEIYLKEDDVKLGNSARLQQKAHVSVGLSADYKLEHVYDNVYRKASVERADGTYYLVYGKIKYGDHIYAAETEAEFFELAEKAIRKQQEYFKIYVWIDYDNPNNSEFSSRDFEENLVYEDHPEIEPLVEPSGGTIREDYYTSACDFCILYPEKGKIASDVEEGQKFLEEWYESDEEYGSFYLLNPGKQQGETDLEKVTKEYVDGFMDKYPKAEVIFKFSYSDATVNGSAQLRGFDYKYIVCDIYEKTLSVTSLDVDDSSEQKVVIDDEEDIDEKDDTRDEEQMVTDDIEEAPVEFASYTEAVAFIQKDEYLVESATYSEEASTIMNALVDAEILEASQTQDASTFSDQQKAYLNYKIIDCIMWNMPNLIPSADVPEGGDAYGPYAAFYENEVLNSYFAAVYEGGSLADAEYNPLTSHDGYQVFQTRPSDTYCGFDTYTMYQYEDYILFQAPCYKYDYTSIEEETTYLYTASALFKITEHELYPVQLVHVTTTTE